MQTKTLEERIKAMIIPPPHKPESFLEERIKAMIIPPPHKPESLIQINII